MRRRLVRKDVAMVGKRWRMAALLSAMALPTLAAGPTRAEEPDLRQLLERLDRLEKRNEALQGTVDAQQEQLRRQQELLDRMQNQPAAPPAEPTAAPKDAASASDADAVRKVVESVLKERQEKADAGAEARPAEGVEVGTDRNLKVTWRDGGLTAESAAQDFRFHVGGIAQFDFGWFSPDQNLQAAFPGSWNDGADIRRLRLRFRS